MAVYIDRENNVTLSGDLAIGAVEVKDHDSETRAEVTQAGLAVEVRNADVIGDAAWVAIDGVERRLDTTSLVSPFGYPMTLELEAWDAPCYIKQGDSTVTLPVIKSRLLADEWRIATVSGVEEAYFAVQRQATTVSGTLVATRIDNM